jgi:hypothetical protein
MAASDYYLCDLCERKAFYDSNIEDPRYVATYNTDTGYEPIGIAVLCSECNKTHKCVVVERSDTEGGE